MDKQYLGDSVYVEIDHGRVKLMTWNGYHDDPRNVIILELDVYDALIAYVERAKAIHRAHVEMDKKEN